MLAGKDAASEDDATDTRAGFLGRRQTARRIEPPALKIANLGKLGTAEGELQPFS